MDQSGLIEQALVGTVVVESAQMIELLRIGRSSDPCLACSVSLASPKYGRARGGAGLPLTLAADREGQESRWRAKRLLWLHAD